MYGTFNSLQSKIQNLPRLERKLPEWILPEFKGTFQFSIEGNLLEITTVIGGTCQTSTIIRVVTFGCLSGSCTVYILDAEVDMIQIP